MKPTVLVILLLSGCVMLGGCWPHERDTAAHDQNSSSEQSDSVNNADNSLD